MSGLRTGVDVSANSFRLCTYVTGGFASVGIGVGDEPAPVIDVERGLRHLHDQGQGDFIVWPDPVVAAG